MAERWSTGFQLSVSNLSERFSTGSRTSKASFQVDGDSSAEISVVTISEIHNDNDEAILELAANPSEGIDDIAR